MSLSFLNGIGDVPRPRKGQVAIWTAELDKVGGARPGQLARSLSLDENERALRLRFERDRNRFVVGRGVLREILGTYLKRDPEKIDFIYGPRGKPYLKDPTGHAVGSLYFNVSHSSDRMIYALGLNEVGVDLEFVRPIPGMQTLVDQYFSVSERTAFGSIPHDLKLRRPSIIVGLARKPM